MISSAFSPASQLTPKMSKMATLDAHSRNCSACIKQRESGSSGAEWRRPSHSHSHQERKKTSLQAETRKFSTSASSSGSMLRRSSSCLSSSSMTGSLREDGGEAATYLTPTQRKNLEIKNIRLELERAKVSLDEKDREIMILRKEVAALKEAAATSKLQESCASWNAETETESVGDSGNCEELVETEEAINNNQEGNNMENFEFELMESALKEEEEYRHQLESDNQELSSKVTQLQQEVLVINEARDKEIQTLRKCHDEDVMQAKKESSQKVEELIIELAESSMRCARQQDAIEQKQLRIDELLQEVGHHKQTISSLTEQREATDTKEQEPTQYLIATQRATISSQTELHSSQLHAATQTHSAEPPEPVEAGDGELEDRLDSMESVEAVLENRPDSKAESTCANNIHYTYQFLRRSVYYYITDKENRAYHLRSIQRLLEFSDAELSVNPNRPVSHKRY